MDSQLCLDEALTGAVSVELADPKPACKPFRQGSEGGRDRVDVHELLEADL